MVSDMRQVGHVFHVTDFNKSELLTPIRQEAIPRTSLYKLLDYYDVYSALFQCVISSPPNMIADGESFPWKSSDEAGWAHDNAYRKDSVVWRCVRGIWTKCPGLNRRQGDALFFEISNLDGVNEEFSYAKWLAVRTLGHWSWHKMNVLDDLETVKRYLG
jgi:hypothetical protein